tara:strand:- start:91 stop:687 length:597 start_codon:yes stop_codon:yes gene_type:complete
MPPKKEYKAKVKLQIPGGQATPAPPVGPALGQHGVPIGEFVQRFNDMTKEQAGTIVPVELYVYADRSFDFIVKSPPAAVLVRKEVGLAKGAQLPGTEVVGEINRAQLERIALAKMEDLNASDIDAAVKMIEGTCRSMGVNVVETGGGPTPAAEDAEVADDSAEEPAEKSGSDSEATAEDAAEATTEDAAGDTAEEAAE